ncbi:MAG: hypothetical protein JRI68_08960 [Deltaproteobacteria bacterium]|nr:hypothetical protein [Deltaproteobacteria bacterium]
MPMPVPKLGTTSREIAAFAHQALLLRHDAGRPVVPTQARPGDDVVVCLHGAFTTAGVLRPLRRRLERHPGVHTATMPYPLGPGVRTLSRLLQERLAELPEDTTVHLVGHSLGGVVARYFAQELGDPRVVQTISLAAPFAGVRHIGRLPVAVARDLAPMSPLLRGLALGSRRAFALPHLSLVADSDVVVKTPIEHALPGGDLAIIRDCGHNSMLFRKDVARLVERRVLDHAGQPLPMARSAAG